MRQVYFDFDDVLSDYTRFIEEHNGIYDTQAVNYTTYDYKHIHGFSKSDIVLADESTSALMEARPLGSLRMFLSQAAELGFLGFKVGILTAKPSKYIKDIRKWLVKHDIYINSIFSTDTVGSKSLFIGDRDILLDDNPNVCGFIKPNIFILETRVNKQALIDMDYPRQQIVTSLNEFIGKLRPFAKR